MPVMPRTLSSRLVVTVVLLVALVSLLIASATTIAMRSYLEDRLDNQVRAALSGGGERGPGGRFGGPGSLRAAYPDDGEAAGFAVVSGSAPGPPRTDTFGRDGRSADQQEALSSAALTELETVPTDGELHDVDLPELGSYRVMAQSIRTAPAGIVVVGLPTGDVEEILGRLIGLEVGIALLAIVASGGVGLVVVRRQLQPLREVAATAERVSETPLSSGSIDLGEHVPAHLRDERTEVGQVGAALNELLAHVETSLEARHRSEQQVRQFVADASHELRTPLATIQGYAELARQHPDDDSGVRAALAKVETESVRMTALVGDLLMLARLDAGRALARDPVDLTMLLIEAVSDARVLAPTHHWRVQLPDEPLVVPGDALALHQVVTNLLTNARKYTPAGSTVAVSATSTAGAVTFRVHDDGPGFAPELLDTAFERFARGDAARSRTIGGQDAGTGLGLALARAIVEAHGGTVGLTSVPGDTSISVVLPLDPQS